MYKEKSKLIWLLICGGRKTNYFQRSCEVESYAAYFSTERPQCQDLTQLLTVDILIVEVAQKAEWLLFPPFFSNSLQTKCHWTKGKIKHMVRRTAEFNLSTILQTSWHSQLHGCTKTQVKLSTKQPIHENTSDSIADEWNYGFRNVLYGHSNRWGWLKSNKCLSFFALKLYIFVSLLLSSIWWTQTHD